MDDEPDIYDVVDEYRRDHPEPVPVDLFGLSVCRRPMLTSGMLLKGKDGRWCILIDSEQSPEEQAIAFWHELSHLLVGDDEQKAEDLGNRLAAAVPEILDILA